MSPDLSILTIAASLCSLIDLSKRKPTTRVPAFCDLSTKLYADLRAISKLTDLDESHLLPPATIHRSRDSFLKILRHRLSYVTQVGQVRLRILLIERIEHGVDAQPHLFLIVLLEHVFNMLDVRC